MDKFDRRIRDYQKKMNITSSQGTRILHAYEEESITPPSSPTPSNRNRIEDGGRIKSSTANGKGRDEKRRPDGEVDRIAVKRRKVAEVITVEDEESPSFRHAEKQKEKRAMGEGSFQQEVEKRSTATPIASKTAGATSTGQPFSHSDELVTRRARPPNLKNQDESLFRCADRAVRPHQRPPDPPNHHRLPHLPPRVWAC